MSYGLKVKDAEGNIAKITPLVSSIVSSGQYTSTSSLNEDGTYGYKIDLPGPTPRKNISVITAPLGWGVAGVSLINITFGTSPNYFYTNQIFANSALTYYSRDNSTAVMTQWIAGNLAFSDPNAWDSMFFSRPLVEWGLITELNSPLVVSIFIMPTIEVIVYDYSISSLLRVHLLYGVPVTTQGVSISMVTIIIKGWDY